MDDFWLRDKMFELLGCYDNITKEYIKECSKSAKTVPELLTKLTEVGFPSDENLCQELLGRFAGIKPPKLSEYDEWIMKQENKDYDLVTEDPI